MFSKIKKVLVSLALASSLALAPMNVSADGTLTKSDSTFETAGYYQFIDNDYSVTVPDSVNFTSEALSQLINIKVDDTLAGHKIKVTPSFTPATGVTASVEFVGGSVTIEGENSASITAKLDDSGITNKENYLSSTEIGKITYTVETIKLNP